jgi:hypothetical protein
MMLGFGCPVAVVSAGVAFGVGWLGFEAELLGICFLQAVLKQPLG